MVPVLCLFIFLCRNHIGCPICQLMLFSELLEAFSEVFAYSCILSSFPSGSFKASDFLSLLFVCVCEVEMWILFYSSMYTYSVLPVQFVEKDFFPNSYILLKSLLKIQWLQLCEFVSVPSGLFCWSRGLFWCQHNTVCTIIGLYNNLRWVILISLALFFLLRAALAIGIFYTSVCILGLFSVALWRM